MKPSILDIGCKLTAAKGMSEFISISHPEQGPAMREFVTTVNQLWMELYHSFYQRPTPNQERHDGCDHIHP